MDFPRCSLSLCGDKSSACTACWQESGKPGGSARLLARMTTSALCQRMSNERRGTPHPHFLGKGASFCICLLYLTASGSLDGSTSSKILHYPMSEVGRVGAHGYTPRGRLKVCLRGFSHNLGIYWTNLGTPIFNGPKLGLPAVKPSHLRISTQMNVSDVLAVRELSLMQMVRNLREWYVPGALGTSAASSPGPPQPQLPEAGFPLRCEGPTEMNRRAEHFPGTQMGRRPPPASEQHQRRLRLTGRAPGAQPRYGRTHGHRPGGSACFPLKSWPIAGLSPYMPMRE